MARPKNRVRCRPQAKLKDRPLLAGVEALALGDTFKLLSNATRLRMIHALVRADELCVSELAEVLDMKPQAVSNQLQRLYHRGIVQARRNGLQIHYRIVDPCVVALLDRGWCLTEDASDRASERAGHERAAS